MKTLEEVIADAPLDSEWLDRASEEELLNVVDDGGLNLLSDYISWHQKLLKYVDLLR